MYCFATEERKCGSVFATFVLMKGKFILGPLFTVLLLSAASLSKSQYVVHDGGDDNRRNQFQLINDTLRCYTHKADSAFGYMPCLRIGNVFMNFSLADVGKFYGKVDMVEDDHNGHIANIYFLPTDDRSQHPYLAVMSTDGKIMGLELTGNETSKEVKFSNLELGAKEKRVIATLGEPSKVTPEDKYMHWDYAPFPFYLLMEDGRLHSVTVSNDGGGVLSSEKE